MGKRTCAKWIELACDRYLVQGGKQSNWDGDYLKILKRLPQDEPLTQKRLIALIEETEVNTRTRKRAVGAVGYLARFANIDFDPSPWAGGYTFSRQAERTIPSDQSILDWGNQLTSDTWRWVYGMVAAYGLRPHEVFLVDLDRLREGSKALKVLDGKTGPRLAMPYPDRWFDTFQLARPRLPGIKLDRSHEALGHSATRYFWQQKIPFGLYDMRHAYALRAMHAGVKHPIAAKMMGHSESVHLRIYRHWIDEAAIVAEWERTTGGTVKKQKPARINDRKR
jgi:hypothetical protein